MSRKLLARFQFLAESDQYLELLEQDKILYYLSGMGIEQDGQTNYSESLEVWVDEENFDKAVQIIKQNEYFSSCPKCDSKDLSEALIENLKKNALQLLKVFLPNIISKNENVYYKCNSCNYIFKK
ncbi:hypothetical protein [Moheibacter sediminis]|uniref:Uncharacterized protein n=1 Tax=Moheibacter sediminis TaxID=1434700 RepID=A0A1W1Z0I6_9FLAO|nr:hypothetical protein [Moheibacter sediminis]SMC41950.1 hypothetical protein SAMN06296427_10283 [Moheibacter sediminis]